MLYYSLPFILACSFGLVSMLSENENSPIARVISLSGVAFFATGLVMLVFLASSATQTSILPSTFSFFLPYFSVPSVEILVFVTILAGSNLGVFAVSEHRRWWQKRDYLTVISLVFFIIGIIIMTSGIRQVSSVAVSSTLLLPGSPDYPMRNVSFPLGTSDQVQVRMKSAENEDFSYVFLDESNYLLYNDSLTRMAAIPLETGIAASNYSFTQVITASSSYYLVLQTRFLSTNVTVYVLVTGTDSSLQVGALFPTSGSVSVLIATSISRPNFYAHALILPNNKQRRRIWNRSKEAE